MSNPFDIVRQFEAELCRYTGAPFAVTTNSCTMALTLAVAWHVQRERFMAMEADRLVHWERPQIEIPKRTYVGVPYAIIEAGGRPTFRDETWTGAYGLNPLPVWDSARWFTSGMYGRDVRVTAGREIFGGMIAVSFHASKTLGLSQGGAVLLDNPEAAAWLRRARFDGRTEGVAPTEDRFDMPRAWHCYMSPDVAAGLLLKLHSLPRHNAPLPNSDYSDLSLCEVFR